MGVVELLIILGIILLLFGASQVPKLARSLGRSSREFKEGLREGAREEPQPQQTPPTTTSSTPEGQTPAE